MRGGRVVAGADSAVMAALDAAIQKTWNGLSMLEDGRVKPGHDGGEFLAPETAA
jgi:hypothetical protein